jgi:hypothetical protein
MHMPLRGDGHVLVLDVVWHLTSLAAHAMSKCHGQQVILTLTSDRTLDRKSDWTGDISLLLLQFF